jgi:DNA mismatch repair protein MutS
MPAGLIQRATEVLKSLEANAVDGTVIENLKQVTAPKMQLSIFDAHTETFEELRTILNGFDINRLTPVEALIKLNEIKGMLK